jgi:ubiquinone/menaquinone biosynthesis C-methylase UbiE
MREARNARAGKPEGERYAIGYSAAMVRAMQQRTLATCAPYFLPYLQPGMAVLDCGCGAGSMTVELAERVAPAVVVGLDMEPRVLAQARELAATRGLGNLQFDQGDVYTLPYPDASFDAVYSHALLSHLREPGRALAEMRRVLKPNGIAAVVENDTATFVVSPAGSAMERFLDLGMRRLRYSGGRQLESRHLRGALLEAGFAVAEEHASAEVWGTPERVRVVAEGLAAQVSSAEFVENMLAQGWATQAELDELTSGLLAWSERPDAVLAVLKCGALGWVNA